MYYHYTDLFVCFVHGIFVLYIYVNVHKTKQKIINLVVKTLNLKETKQKQPL